MNFQADSGLILLVNPTALEFSREGSESPPPLLWFFLLSSCLTLIVNFHPSCQSNSKLLHVVSPVDVVCRICFSIKGKRSPYNKRAFKEGISLSNQFAIDFIKIYQEIKKLYAFEVSIISFMESSISVCLWRHSILIIYAKMKQIRFENKFLSILCIYLIKQ